LLTRLRADVWETGFSFTLPRAATEPGTYREALAELGGPSKRIPTGARLA